MPYDVSPEVLAEDARIRAIQERNDLEREAKERHRAQKRADSVEQKATAKSLGMWNEKNNVIKTQSIVSQLMKIDRQKAIKDASAYWDEIMGVYAKGLQSEDEKHAKACADALKSMIIGKDAPSTPIDPNMKTAMIVESVDELAMRMGLDDEEDDG
jgi:rubrerythrin